MRFNIWCIYLGASLLALTALSNTCVISPRRGSQARAVAARTRLAPMLKNQPSPQPLMIDNQYLEMVQTTKILGVYLTSDLKWTKHVTHICSKESKRLYALRLLKRNGVQSRDLQKVYCRSFHSSHVIPNVLVIVVCHIV